MQRGKKEKQKRVEKLLKAKGRREQRSQRVARNDCARMRREAEKQFEDAVAP